ncbi:MAG: glycosyltransferase family 39 protein [Anaerolineae bacterium]|nr:glycosyltransferase family 39 protein [Candidatus Roseilinea sp.]MDW8451569.1 glycosyltransferase family 39 protein [Anaerolineae bacterium]
MTAHRRTHGRALILLVLLAALAIRAFDLAGQSLWYDEAFSVRFAQQNDILALFIREAQLNLNTPLHYILLKGWMFGLGDGEFAVRLLSVFAGVASVALAYRLGALILNQSSLIPAVLVALSPVGVMAAQDVRMHAFASCLSLGATVAFLTALRSERPVLWLTWGVLGVLAFATHVLSALFVGIHIVVGIALRLAEGRSISRPHLVASAITGVVILVWAVLLWSNRASYGVSYDASADWPALMLQTAAGQVLPRLLPAELVAPAGVAVMIALVLSCATLIVMRDQAQLAGALAAIAVGSLIAMATFCAVVGKFSPRYPSIIAPIVLATIGVAIAVAAKRGRMAQALARAGFASLALGFSAGLLTLRTSPLYANEDFRGAVAHIRARLQPDERVLLVSGHFAPAFEYYWTGAPDAWIALPPDPVLNVHNTLTYTSVVPATNAALAGMGGAWLLLWQDDVIDPTGVALALLRRQSQAFAPQPDTPQFAGLRLQHYRFFQPYRPLPEQIPPSEAVIEHNRPEVGLRSLGCVQPQPARAGDGFMEVQCFWQTQPFVPLSVYTKVSLRLADVGGEQVLQSDQPIAYNGFPYVPYEKPIWGVHVIPLPPDLQSGDYTLRVIPYTETGEISPQVSLPVQVSPR